MQWSLSEFLNLLELRGQRWCVVELCSSGGISIPHYEVAFFYAVIEGSVQLTGATPDPMQLEISDRIGYRSQAAFSRRFTSYYVMSPGRMRRVWRQRPNQLLPSDSEILKPKYRDAAIGCLNPVQVD